MNFQAIIQPITLPDSDSRQNLAKIQLMSSRFKWLRSTQFWQMGLGILLVWLMWALGTIERLSSKTTIEEYLITAALLSIVLANFIHIAIRYMTAIQAKPLNPVCGVIFPPRSLLREKVLLSINLGGALLPLCYCILFLFFFELSWLRLSAAILMITLSSYLLSRPIPGIGIVLPIFVLPIITAAVCHWLFNEYEVIGAYISGTIGVILGADLLRLKDLLRLDSSFISIGGSGYLDSIVLNAIFAVLLLSYW